jgi:hypothetical protein
MKISSGRLIVSFVVISLLTLLSIKTSLALSIDPSLLQLNKNILKIDPWALRCGNIKTKADAKIAKFEKNYTNHYGTYIKLEDRLKERISYWGGLGYNVDQLNKDLKAIQEKIAKYNKDYTAYMDKLDVIKAIDCDNTEADLTNALKEAKDALKEVRKDVVDIKTFYWSTVRQDIMELRKQKISNSEE